MTTYKHVGNRRMRETPNTVEVHDYGRHPETLIHTHEGHVSVRFVAPNGRLYGVRLDGNKLRVASLEGGIYVRPKADNVVEVVNLTPFELTADRAMDGEEVESDD